MTKAWHRANPESFAQMRADVEAAYPNLNFFIDHEVETDIEAMLTGIKSVSGEDDILVIRGSFPIKDEHGKPIDQFSIEVFVPPDFPKNLPLVREVRGRIPRHVDRHIYPEGFACLFAPGERFMHFPEGSTLLDFLEGPVRNFFISQSTFELTGEWPFGQRSHDSDGIVESYAEMFGVPPMRENVARFLLLIQRREVKGHWPCPCGNGKRLRDCHGPIIRHLKTKVSPGEAIRTLAGILGLAKKAVK